MKRIGGEFEFGQDGIFYCFTDSGRSSLRLILRSGLSRKKFLVPNFICKIILDILDQENVDYSFYNINEDLSIDKGSLKAKDFDVLYVIDYFGQRQEGLDAITGASKILIEDAVFLPEVKKPKGIKNWIGFNSLRKILPLADGSLIQSTVKLNENLIHKAQAPFVDYKYKAKAIKYEFINENRHKEKDYLRLFKKGEVMIDQQALIYMASAKSLYSMIDFFKKARIEKEIRDDNYYTISKLLKKYSIGLHSEFYSFCILRSAVGDRLRKFLFKKKVFLPVHWPENGKVQNILYRELISIPVDSRYNKQDMKHIAGLIGKFLRKA